MKRNTMKLHAMVGLLLATMCLAAPPPSAVYSLTLESGAAGGGDLAVRVVTTLGAVTEGRAGDAAADTTGVTADATGLRGDVKVGADLWTLDATVQGEKVSGKWRGTVGGKAANGALTGTVQARDTDWPRWRGPYGSGMGVGCGQPLVDDLGDMRLVWRSEERAIPANAWHNGTQGGYDSPIVANGKVFLGYFKGAGDIIDPDILKEGDSKKAGPDRAKWNAAVATEDTVLCADAKTGKTLWKTVLGEGINLFTMRKAGPHNAVCWHNGRIYAQSTMGRVYCLNDADGSIVWQQDIAATAQQIKVLETWKQLGRMRHRYEGNPPPELKACGDPRLFMYPLCVADGVVVADGGVFDAATGTPMPWPKPPASNGDRNPTCPLRWVCDGQEFFIIGNRCLRPRTGEVLWSIKEAGGVTPAISGNYLVAARGGDGFVGCRINAKGYQVLWTNADYVLAGAVAATGVIADGWFLAVVNKGKTLGGRVASDPVSEMAIAIELATGTVAGPVSFAGIRQTLSTSPAGMDGRWFFHVGAGNSGMVMMNASGKDFRQIGLRMATVKSPTALPGGTKTKDRLDYCVTSTPALAGGFIYFRGSDCLWCYDLRKP